MRQLQDKEPMEDSIPDLAEAEEFLRSLPQHILLEPGAHPLIIQSYLIAAHSHKHQLRRSGEPYFTHPIAVALLLADIYPSTDAAMVCAALLHDTIEDCGISREEIASQTTPEIAQMVDGLTNVDDPDTGHAHEENTFRKFGEHAKLDPRISFIKFADLLHNLDGLSHLPQERQDNFIKRVNDKYIPLARELKQDLIANLLKKKIALHASK
jgi:GTP diphosphokinase / guanosine-3',5'-bis(diphosphate) 3'-diphosphatase